MLYIIWFLCGLLAVVLGIRDEQELTVKQIPLYILISLLGTISLITAIIFYLINSDIVLWKSKDKEEK